MAGCWYSKSLFSFHPLSRVSDFGMRNQPSYEYQQKQFPCDPSYINPRLCLKRSEWVRTPRPQNFPLLPVQDDAHSQAGRKTVIAPARPLKVKSLSLSKFYYKRMSSTYKKQDGKDFIGLLRANQALNYPWVSCWSIQLMFFDYIDRIFRYIEILQRTSGLAVGPKIR